MIAPTPGTTWQHFKHSPETPHLYEMICVTEPGDGPQDAPGYFTAIHTETEQWLDVMPAAGAASCEPDDDRFWLFPPQDEPFVIYKAVGDDSGKCWARPLSSFMAADDRSPNGHKFWQVLL